MEAPRKRGLSGLDNHGNASIGITDPSFIQLSRDPDIYVKDNFFSCCECQALMLNLACDRPSTTEFGQSENRTSKSCRIIGDFVPTSRIHDLIPVPSKNFEPIGAIQYEEGGRYAYHHDYFKEDHSCGNRIATVLVYLNDNEAGTHFKELDITVVPKRGRCLVFFPCFKNGERDPRLLHAGCTVETKRKYILQTWVRLRPYTQ